MKKFTKVSVSKDDSRYTIEFKNHYLIKPSINLNINSSHLKNILKEKGKKTNLDFQYNSGTNNEFLNVKKIQKYLNNI